MVSRSDFDKKNFNYEKAIDGLWHAECPEEMLDEIYSYTTYDGLSSFLSEYGLSVKDYYKEPKPKETYTYTETPKKKTAKTETNNYDSIKRSLENLAEQFPSSSDKEAVKKIKDNPVGYGLVMYGFFFIAWLIMMFILEIDLADVSEDAGIILMFFVPLIFDVIYVLYYMSIDTSEPSDGTGNDKKDPATAEAHAAKPERISLLRIINEELKKLFREICYVIKDNLPNLIKAASVCLIIAFISGSITLCNSFIVPMARYSRATDLYEAEQFVEAEKIFSSIDYKDSQKMSVECRYQYSLKLVELGDYSGALESFGSLPTQFYKNTFERIKYCKYMLALEMEQNGNYKEALDTFKSLNMYSDSEDHYKSCTYRYAEQLLDEGNDHQAALYFWNIRTYSDSEQRSYEIWRKYYQDDWLSTSFAYTLGITARGTVLATGDNKHNRCNVSGWHDIIALKTSQYHSVGLHPDGTVSVCGSFGEDDHVAKTVAYWKDIISIEAYYGTVAGVTADGRILLSGMHDYNYTYASENWKDIVEVCLAKYIIVGLRSNGTVTAKGRLSGTDSYDVRGWTDIVAISCSSRHIVGLKSDGTVVATGDNTCGQCNVSEWTDIKQICTAWGYTLGLRNNGTVVFAGENNHGELDVEQWKNIVCIAAGGTYTLGLMENGRVVSTGSNYYGQCDVGDWELIVTKQNYANDR